MTSTELRQSFLSFFEQHGHRVGVLALHVLREGLLDGAHGRRARIDDLRRALAEDVGTGDLTAALLPADKVVRARLLTRQDAVLCGTEWFERTVELLKRIQIEQKIDEVIFEQVHFINVE